MADTGGSESVGQCGEDPGFGHEVPTGVGAEVHRRSRCRVTVGGLGNERQRQQGRAAAISLPQGGDGDVARAGPHSGEQRDQVRTGLVGIDRDGALRFGQPGRLDRRRGRNLVGPAGTAVRPGTATAGPESTGARHAEQAVAQGGLETGPRTFHLQGGERRTGLFQVPSSEGQVLHVHVEGHVAHQGDHLGVEVHPLDVVSQVLAQLGRERVEVGVETVEVAVLVDQLGRRLLPHPGDAGQVVGRVAAQ